MILRRWAAIYTVAAALERKIWTITRKGKLFPNLYVFLVAPPGIGKSLVLNLSRQLLLALGDDTNHPHVSPTNMSKASLADALAHASRKIDRFREDPINPFVTFNSLSVMAPELGNLLPEYDTNMMNFLTDMWDCGAYVETKRGKDIKLEVPHAQLNLLGGCTPSYLNGVIPPPAWDQGFMSRTVLAYSGESLSRNMFDDIEGVDLPESLTDDLNCVFNLYGEYVPSAAFKEAFHAWQGRGYDPLPNHPRLQGYVVRRPAIVLKLAMIAAAAEGADLILEARHFQSAMEWAVEAETVAPEIFKASGLGGDSAIMDETFRFMFDLYMRNGSKALPETLIYDFLKSRVAANTIPRIIEIMLHSGMLEEVVTRAAGGRAFYKPCPVQRHQV